MSAVIISVLALALAVAAFWWIFLRRGVIVTPPPDTYATPPGPTRLPRVAATSPGVPQTTKARAMSSLTSAGSGRPEAAASAGPARVCSGWPIGWWRRVGS